jgi:hypothetical protein
MMLASNRDVVAAMIAVAALFLWRQAPWPLVSILVLLLSVGISEAAGMLLLKPWVHRARPCRALATRRVVEGCDEGRSFPSDHAAIAASTAVAIAFRTPPLRSLRFPWPCLSARPASISARNPRAKCSPDMCLGTIVAVRVARAARGFQELK